MNAEEIRVPLGGDPSEVAGHDWPTRDDLVEFRGHTEDTQQWPAGRSTLRTSTRGSNAEVHVEIRPTGQEDWYYSLTVVPVR